MEQMSLQGNEETQYKRKLELEGKRVTRKLELEGKRVTKRHNTRENWSWREKWLKKITEEVRGYFCPSWVIFET